MKKIFIICILCFLAIEAIADKNTDNDAFTAACAYFEELYKYQVCLVKKGEKACKELIPGPLKEFLTNPPQLANAYIESFKVNTGTRCAVICAKSLNGTETKDCLEKKQAAQRCILAEVRTILETKCGVEFKKKPIKGQRVLKPRMRRM